MRFTTRQFIRQECERTRRVVWLPTKAIPKYIILQQEALPFDALYGRI